MAMPLTPLDGQARVLHLARAQEPAGVRANAQVAFFVDLSRHADHEWTLLERFMQVTQNQEHYAGALHSVQILGMTYWLPLRKLEQDPRTLEESPLAIAQTSLALTPGTPRYVEGLDAFPVPETKAPTEIVLRGSGGEDLT